MPVTIVSQTGNLSAFALEKKGWTFASGKEGDKLRWATYVGSTSYDYHLEFLYIYTGNGQILICDK